MAAIGRPLIYSQPAACFQLSALSLPHSNLALKKPEQKRCSQQAIAEMRALSQDECVFTGGHFAAMEEPELLAEDIIKFFSKHH